MNKLPGRHRPAWLACLLAAAGLHALMLTTERPVSAVLHAPAMQTRWMLVLSGVPEALPGVGMDSAAVPAPQLRLRHELGRQAVQPALEHLQPGGGRPESASLGDALYSFLPRPLLSRGPAPITPIWLDWPEDGDRTQHYRAVLALFIDEDGLVQRTRLESGYLPPDLLDRARRAFQSARFWPGELNERIVRSRLLVELSFEQQGVDVAVRQLR